MSFHPAFMKQFAEFDADRQGVKTLEEWDYFSKKWFDQSNWPLKTPQQLAQEQSHKHSPLSLQGRLWGYTSYTYDISPEARYELFSTLSNVGDPIRFPHLMNIPKTKDSPWTQQCPWCEISTEEIGSGRMSSMPTSTNFCLLRRVGLSSVFPPSKGKSRAQRIDHSQEKKVRISRKE